MGNQVSDLKGLMCYINQSETQHRSSSLNYTWITGGNLLTDYRMCTRGAGICKNFRRGRRCWCHFSCPTSAYLARHLWESVMKLSIYHASMACLHCPSVVLRTHLRRYLSKTTSAQPYLAGSLSQTMHPSQERLPHPLPAPGRHTLA